MSQIPPIFQSSTESRLGSLGVVPVILCPHLPNIVAEWAAILPLVCHLATQRDDYIITGEISLLGRLSIGIFPRLGTLSGFARLLDRGTKFLDLASTRGGSSRTVWDVRWGSVFPCANGAASLAIARYLLARDRPQAMRMPEHLPPSKRDGEGNGATPARDGATPVMNKTEDSGPNGRAKANHVAVASPDVEPTRRYQRLNVYKVHHSQRRCSKKRCYRSLRQQPLFHILRCMALMLFGVFLCLLGAYGTAMIVFACGVSQVVAHGVAIRRPSTYLKSNETLPYASMLVASHDNAMEWSLFVGDRGIIDTLFNKPMFVVPEHKAVHWAASWFWLSHNLQLAAMTFVAAQKGWDGVFLAALVCGQWVFHSALRGPSLVRDWLECEGVDGEVKTFEFGGRFAMLGAIQGFTGSNVTRWMDNILVPHPRRDAFLAKLRGDTATDVFNPSDQRWIDNNVEAALAATAVLKSQICFGVDA